MELSISLALTTVKSCHLMLELNYRTIFLWEAKVLFYNLIELEVKCASIDYSRLCKGETDM